MIALIIALVALSVPFLIHRSYRMQAAIDRLTAAIQANASATAALVTAYQTAPENFAAAINVLASQIEAQTADLNTVLGTTPPVAP